MLFANKKKSAGPLTWLDLYGDTMIQNTLENMEWQLYDSQGEAYEFVKLPKNPILFDLFNKLPVKMNYGDYRYLREFSLIKRYSDKLKAKSKPTSFTAEALK